MTLAAGLMKPGCNSRPTDTGGRVDDDPVRIGKNRYSPGDRLYVAVSWHRATDQGPLHPSNLLHGTSELSFDSQHGECVLCSYGVSRSRLPGGS